MTGWAMKRILATAIMATSIAGAALSAHGAAQERAPGLKVLAGIERGNWQLRERGDGAARTMCIDDARAILQLRHPGMAQCSRFVIEDEARSGTVHYSCPGSGHGRTTITLETPRLARISTSGIARGLPFDDQIEARRTGACR